ncbi:hypothetical protein CK203_057567 [Vitis vinifera]|uniref:Uncharacterized protein n=1 Tax=Vitis vinifera TaxID=29760 RepID=A0A438GGW1_VITVI|nr:hypothetical protein CK203_057567 [Vitis vinifera]
MPLSQALRKLTEAGLLTALTSRPPPQPIPPQFMMDLHCAYHQGPGHETDRCTTLMHAIQDLIDQGLVHLGQPSMPTPFRLVPEAASVKATIVESLTISHYSVQTPFILVLDVEKVQTPHINDSQTLDVQYILREGRILRQPPPAVARPLEGISALEEYSLRCFDTSTEPYQSRYYDHPEGLIHMMTTGRATYIVFSDDDLPSEGSDHMRPLYISIGCSGRQVPSVLLDNGSALNVCSLAIAIALGYAPSDFGPSTQTVRAYDNTRREVIGTLEIELLIAWSTVVLDMMRACPIYLHGVGSASAWASEFMAIPNQDVPFRLGFVPIEANYRYMARLVQGADEIDKHRTFFEVRDIVDRAAPHDEYINEMLAMSLSQIEEIVQPGLASPFDFLDHPRELRIGSDLSADKRDSLVQLLRSYLDVFAWFYEDMSGLDPSIIHHRLPLLPHARSVKQKLR